jgi:hypothetical protein
MVYFFRSHRDEFTKWQRIVLTVVRLVYTAVLLLLLLNPLLGTLMKRLEKPILLVGVDNSESVVNNGTNADFVKGYTDALKKELDERFQLEFIQFGEKVRIGDQYDFKDKVSNYSDFFNEIDKRYYNLNVGAVMLIGDGIFNEGRNPEQMVSMMKVPVYTIGLGDTLSKSDQAIVDVSHNPNVFLGNSFPIEIETNFTDFKLPSTQLTVTIGGRIVYSEQIEVPQSDYYLKRTLNLKADEPGLKTVVVSLSPFTNEANTVNNQSRFTIEIHNNKNKVLFLSQGPHPDIGTITETLFKQANYLVTFSDIALFSGDVKNFDLVVFNQLPSSRNPNSAVYKQVIDQGVPLLIIVGPNTSISTLNNLNIEFSMEPTLLKEESTPFFNPAFPYFALPANIKEAENIYPPLLTYYTDFKLSSNYAVLAYQRIKGINMNSPLIAMGEVNGRKIGIITGEGIWRWRIQEFQNYNNQNMFNQLIAGMFDYLCLKEIRDQFKLEYKRIISETTPVEFKAQLFNELYQPINTNEIAFTLTDSTGNELKYLFSPNEISYHLNVGTLLPGKYRFEASTTIGDKELKRNGEFVVQELNIEQVNLHANFQALSYIAATTKGQFKTKANASELIDRLKSDQSIKTVTIEEKNVSELIDWKICVLLVILLFFLEWFLRKYWGSY